MFRILQYCLLTSLFTLSAFANAQSAHVHGTVSLSIGIESGFVEIQLESPAANIVGFEYRARSNDQKRAVASAGDQLRQVPALFTFGGVECQPVSADVDMSAVASDDPHDDHAPVSKHDDEHRHEHGHHHHDKHDHHGGKHASDHADITASYRFRCRDDGVIQSVSTALFQQFPGIESIKVMWVTESAQGSAMLKRNKTAFSVR